MNSRILSPAVAAGTLLISGPAWADAATVDDVVVTANRRPTPADAVGSSVTVIRRDDIERFQWRSLPEALQLSPGLNVVQTGGTGGRASVFIRGANANHTKVLIDGVDANDPSQGGVFDFGAILTSDIERIEVLRGPQSGLYGSDAIGGVVNIVTRPPGGPLRLRARLEGGAHETFDQGAGVSGQAGVVGFAFDLAHARTGASDTTPLALLPAGRARHADSYENLTLSGRLNARPSARLELDGTVRWSDGDLRFTGDEGFPSAPAAEPSRQDARSLVTRGEARIDAVPDRLEVRAGVGRADYRTRLQGPGGAAPTYNRGDRTEADLRFDLVLPRGAALVAGIEAERERLKDQPVRYRNDNRAAFAELHLEPAGDLNLTASVRYDDNDRFGGEATWRLAGVYELAATGARLKASYGTGFKAPSLTQLFVSFPDFGFFANPDLDPETSRGFDVGFEQPLGGRVEVGATYFRQTIRNLIQSNAAFTSYENVGRARAEGVEAYAALRLSAAVTARADYTYVDAEDRATGLALLRRPKHRATLSAAWTPAERVALSGSVVHVGGWVDGDRSFTVPRLKADGYTVANLAGEYRLSEAVVLFGRVENLFDERFENPVGFQQPGRGAFAGVRVQWGRGQ
ncbi:TonB-dependent receptor plug domain-containing protein [Phenylobacterium zucineum]|nr:TonB-dependent receptor [Phenylobacterium zucineum]